MKILLISGHGAGDPGAVGNGLQEATEARDVVNRLAPLLRKYATVDVLNQGINAFTQIQAGSVPFGRGYDYVLEIHFNAGGGVGTEIFVTNSEAATGVEQSIMNKMGKYFKVRGVKRTNFSVIYTAKSMGMSAALLEVCFIDSASDTAAYKNNKQAIAQAVCDGIAEGFGLKATSNESSAAQPSAPSNTTNNTNKKKKGEIEMKCTFQVDNKAQFWYYDGTNVKALNATGEVEALRMIYKDNNGQDMPHYKWSSKAPWYIHLMDVAGRENATRKTKF